MKQRLVLWGEKADQKALIALELLVEENQVKILSFPEEVADDSFYEKMRTDWREGLDVEIPESHIEESRDLTAAESLLPEDIRVERTDLIEQKKLEWQVVVLSSKMYKQFESELGMMKDKIEKLESFDSGTWESLKSFWAKVQEQVREGLLSRGYEKELRKTSDQLFDTLKGLRKKMNEDLREKSKENYDWFMAALDGVDKKIEEGLRLSGVFDELKELQNKYYKTKFSREFREKIWSRIDGSFKAVKEKKYGKRQGDSSPLGRLENRYQGLLGAIERTERSKNRDDKDLEFEKRRMANTDGQLEAQIRQAKVNMIEQRLKIKADKLANMYSDKEKLETKMAKIKEDQRVAELRKQKEAEAKAKISEETAKAKEVDDATKEKLAAAAEKINDSKKKASGILSKIKENLEDAKEEIQERIEDATDTMKAAAIVASEKLEPFTEKGEKIIKDVTSMAEEKLVDAKEKMEEKVTEVSESLKETVSEAKEKAEEVKAEVKEEIADLGEDIKDAAEDLTEEDKKDT